MYGYRLDGGMAKNRNVLSQAAGLPRWSHPVLVGAIVFAFLLALWPRFAERLDPLTGDEPFYVMTSISLLHDRDLDESNNYEAVIVQGDAGPYTLYAFDASLNPDDPLPANWQGWPSPPRLVGAHAATTTKPGLYTKHAIGLSALIAVPWELAGRFGANLVVMLAAALLAGQMFLLGRESGAGPSLAGLIAIGLAVAIPLGPYSLLLFPEIPAALLLIYAVRRANAPNAAWQWLLCGCAVGFLPWLHQRFAPTAVVVSIIIFIRILQSRDVLYNAALALIPIGIGGVGLLFYNQWLYGVPLQRSEDHAGFNRFIGTLNGGFGLLLDAQWGLLITAPVFLLALAAVPRWLRDYSYVANVAVAAVAPYLIVVAAYKVWWGEWGPPARYLVPVVPLAAGPLAAWLRTASTSWRIATYGLWSVGLLATIVGYQDPQRFYHHPDGVNNLIVTLGDQLHLNAQRVLVAFQPYSIAPASARVWISVALLVTLAVVAREVSGLVLRGSGTAAWKSFQKNLRIG